MELYNTLTKQKEELKPIKGKLIKFYHCGPTVYWAQHIGNLRAMTMGDLIRRSLMYMGFEVNYVRNYTDVGHLTSDADEGEDKMEKGAKREGLSPEEIADKYIQIFENDIKKINLLEPTHKSKATAKISEIIQMIQVLLEKQAAYITPKAIYFDVTKAQDYPAFSNKKLEDQRTGAGKGEIVDSNKRHPADFVLWFFKTGVHKNALQFWPSPFKSENVANGEGFPGWHIECSVIAESFLGKTLDIHMGGVEHIPIHHPNEIAQSETANEQKFANYWLHNEHLLVNDRKMSKSEGTGFSLQEIQDRGFDPMDLRYFFLTAHYRSKQNFTWSALEAAKNARIKLINQLRTITGKGQVNSKLKDQFLVAIKDDVNIPNALAIVWEVLKSNIPEADKKATILDFDQVLGLKLKESLLEKEAKLSEAEKTQVKELLAQREAARKTGDFAQSDQIRDTLKEKYNVEIKDTPEGTKWRII